MSMMGNAGPSVLQEGATEEKGEHARLASFVGAMAILRMTLLSRTNARLSDLPVRPKQFRLAHKGSRTP